MEIIVNAFQYIMHIGPHIGNLAKQYGTTIYIILFLIIFCETGVVLTPFLPGDSMLFVIGALAATEKLSIQILIPSLLIAAILGYWLNYYVGKKLAHKIVDDNQLKFINRIYLKKTEDFYKKYGPKALVLARFMPFTRTFASFLAGVGNMQYSHFQFYNIVSAFLWIPTIIGLGYFFGNIPIIRDNFIYVVITIVIVSLLPVGFEIFKHKKNNPPNP